MTQKQKQYSPLHLHSEFSTLDGYATIDEYIKAALENGMPGLGLSDHGTASGLYQFITKAQKAGLIPVPGIEFYVAPENPLGAKIQGPIFYGPGGKKAPKYDISNGAYTHLTVFAYNNIGLSNLFKLTSISYHPENFYFKPRIDTNMLAEHSEGLIVTTGCPSSEINRRFLLGQDDKAYEYAGRLKSIFGSNMYIEIMDHKMEGEELERILLPKLRKLSKDLDILMIATNDSHYAFKRDAIPHERVLAVSTKSNMSEKPFYEGGTRFAFSTPEYYVKPYDEIIKDYPEDIAEEILANTLELMNKCKDIKLEYDPHLRPEIEIPEGYTAPTYLQKLIFEGFERKRGDSTKEIKAESVKRIQEEFTVLHSNDFIDYFLVVEDYIAYAHKNNIGVGAGRGSVGGSEIAYVLDISNTDPIRFDLLFERFLSPGRGSLYQIDYVSGESEEIAVSAKKRVRAADGTSQVRYIHELYPGDTVNFNQVNLVIKDVYVKQPGSAPDVDTDFNTEGREKVVQYCIDKYGKENVSNIITFGTFKAKKAFKAIAKVYNVPYSLSDKASKFIPGGPAAEASLAEIMDPGSRWYNEGSDFRNAIDSPIFNEVIEMSTALEGRIGETGVHPCGVIIGNQPLAGIIPTQVRQDDGVVVAQWTYPELEALGLIKMDFLGLELINTVQQTLDNIKLTNESARDKSEIRDIPDIDKLIKGPMDDAKTYENLREGNTIGIFQLGSPGVRDLLKRSQPTDFMDIATITALYRPGPMSMQSHNEWADRKNGIKDVIYIDEKLKGTVVQDILEDTQGLLVFQESLMQIATKYAGMTSYESDLLRKAMGKKKIDIMMSMKPKFISGAIENGSTKQTAENVWETMEGFASYGFNKCVSADTSIATLKHGKLRVKKLYELQENNPDEELIIYSMYEDGKIKPHTVSKIVKSGRKPLYTIITESGKKIRVTKEHRLLTTDGYGTIEDGKLSIGNDLIIDEEWGKKLHPNTIKTRKATMAKLNKTEKMREQSRNWMTKYQSTLTFENRSEHQKYVSATTDRSDKVLPLGRAKLAELRKDDEWNKSFSDACEKARQRAYESGELVGYGKPTKMDNGEWADSMVEALVGNYLLERDIEFELHKPVINSTKVCDFYVNGLYFEMDGMRRGREYFETNKYGKDIPFVYMTPKDFGDVIDEAIMTHHIENGDKIVDIIEPKLSKKGEQYTEMTYDIEMKTTGPANFIANGIVSHNSHSVSYALNIYQSIYLKTHYPNEFMAALIQQGIGTPDKVKSYIQEAMRMKLRLGPVDINTSQVQMASTGVNPDNEYDIVFGFSGVKQTNLMFAEAIVEERNTNGLYKSVADFVKRIAKRTPITASPLSSLALAGAFDGFNVSRKLVSEKAKMIIDSGAKTAAKGASLFDMMTTATIEDVTSSIELEGEDFDFNEMIKLEADTIGMFVSGHPTSKLGHIANVYKATDLYDILCCGGSKTTFTVLGTVTQMKIKTNKAGNKSIALLIDDGSETSATYLPKHLVESIEKYEELARLSKAKEKGVITKVTKRSEKLLEIVNDENITPMEPIELNEPYVFTIKTRGWGENVKIVIDDIQKLYTAPDGSLPYEINIANKSIMSAVSKLLKKHKDNKGTYVKVNMNDRTSLLLDTRVKLSLDFIMDMEKTIGKENIVTEGI